jgi:hypothetical protein
MKREDMNKYQREIFEEMSKELNFVTKITDGYYKVQKDKESMCQGFYVNLLPQGYIVMSGDFDGVMVRPYGARCLITWMANATTLGYFMEKVHGANRYHATKEFCEELAENNLKEIKECFLEGYEGENLSEKEQEWADAVSYFSFENEFKYWEQICEIERELDIYDLYEYDPKSATSQIVWQHKCLVFWALKVKLEEFEEVKD